MELGPTKSVLLEGELCSELSLSSSTFSSKSAYCLQQLLSIKWSEICRCPPVQEGSISIQPEMKVCLRDNAKKPLGLLARPVKIHDSPREVCFQSTAALHMCMFDSNTHSVWVIYWAGLSHTTLNSSWCLSPLVPVAYFGEHAKQLPYYCV